MNSSLKYDAFNIVDSNIEQTGGSVKYAMVPVWILTTKYEGKPYTFMMNGQTGKFVGSLPSDKGKEKKYMMVCSVLPVCRKMPIPILLQTQMVIYIFKPVKVSGALKK